MQHLAGVSLDPGLFIPLLNNIHEILNLCVRRRNAVVQAAGIPLRSDELRKLALPELTPVMGAAPDDAAREACDKLVLSVMAPDENAPIVVECVTSDDADRILATVIRCARGSIATTPGSITSMVFGQVDGCLQEISTLNHCGHL